MIPTFGDWLSLAMFLILVIIGPFIFWGFSKNDEW